MPPQWQHGGSEPHGGDARGDWRLTQATRKHPGLPRLRATRRPLAVAVLTAILAGAIVIVAIGDHIDKQERMNRAELAEWYCAHQASRCRGPSSQSIERHWNQRELGYKIALTAVLLSGGATFVAVKLRSI